ncbi:hypothetical protein HF1_11410 [Mycoplasma haemofelis str. Langford 1]|uniref:Uncharacterized protein n=1 Tax=Mycoplasma haemofelis (strain Langford 1) TaxID=941640 RepID=E8ZJ28_MYCHL|nr:hypothetical protein [Mycoplasma haemofelis]CBY93149.1 hypothetical protein HF1_11410 [Mycoplasma haemofelis str. Langford 1]
MNSSLALKSLAGIGGVLAATGAAIGIPKLLEDKRQLISKLIEIHNPKKRLITATSLDDPSWKKSWEAYRKANKDAAKGKDTFQLPDWSGPISESISEVSAVQSLLNACSSNSKKKSSLDSPLYQDVLKYCTRDTLISDLLKESGRKLLSKTRNNANSAEWRGVWAAYVKVNTENTGDAWGISSYQTEKAKSGDSFSVSDDFMTKCESKLASSSIEDKTLLDQVKSWCTIEQ